MQYNGVGGSAAIGLCNVLVCLKCTKQFLPTSVSGSLALRKCHRDFLIGVKVVLFARLWKQDEQQIKPAIWITVFF
jgi:hypothetical protein